MRIGVQTGGVTDVIGQAAGYAAIAQAGFTAIDWNIDHALFGHVLLEMAKTGDFTGKCIFERPLEEVIAHYAEELALIRKNGLSIAQAHAPFPAYFPGHPEVLEYMIGIYCRAIELCDYAGCPNLVIHGISLADSDRGNTPADIERLNWHLYESLIPTLLRCNVTVCLENLFTWDTNAVEGVCSDIHEAIAFVDGLNEKAGREVFGFCVDTGHLHLLRKNFRTFIPALGKRIKALHIHDNNGSSDQHMAPFTGTIPWAALCDALKEAGYEGDLGFETFNQVCIAQGFDRELLIPWLNVICRTGEAFRKRIQG